MESKICSKCKIDLEISNFNKNKSRSDGYGLYCKNCRTIKRKEQRSRTGEKDNQRTKIWREKNPDKYKQSNEKYLKNNFEKAKKAVNKYQKNNREKIKKFKCEYNKKKILTDPLFKLKKNIRTLITLSIKRRGLNKNNNTVNILGCSFEKFKKYIESKFAPWMNWDNYGKYNGTLNFGWDIDHIMPMSSAKTEQDVFRLNHFINLQPLCSKINRDIKKGNTNISLFILNAHKL